MPMSILALPLVAVAFALAGAAVHAQGPASVRGAVPARVVAANRSPLLQLGHDGPVTSLSCSRDGRLIVSTGCDGFLKVWNASNGRLIAQTTRQSGWIRCSDISPDSRTVAAGLDDGRVTLWNPLSGRALGQWRVSTTGGVTALAYSTRGDLLVAGSSDGCVRIRPSGSTHGMTAWTFRGMRICGLAFSPDGTSLAIELQGLGRAPHGTNGTPDQVELRDVRTGKLCMTYLVPSGVVGPLSLSRGGTELAQCCGDGSALVIDLACRKVRLHLARRSSPFTSICFSPTGRLILTGDAKGSQQIWSSTRGSELSELQPSDAFEPGAPVQWAGCDDLTAAGKEDGGIDVRRMRDGSAAVRVGGRRAPKIASVALSRGGGLLAIGLAGSDNVECQGLFVLREDMPDAMSWVGLREPLLASSFSPAGESLLTICAHEATIWGCWGTRPVPTRLASDKAGHLFPRALFTRDGACVLLARTTGGIEFRDSATGDVVRTVLTGSDPLCGYALTGDGGRLDVLTEKATLTGTAPELHVYDSVGTHPSASVARYVSHRALSGGENVAVAGSPDGRFLVVGSEIRDATSGKLLCRLSSLARHAAFTRDTRLLATDFGQVWNVWGRAEKARLELPDGCALTCLTASRDGSRFIGGCDDGVVRVWNSATGGLLLSVYLVAGRSAKSTPEWIAVSVDGRTECSAGGAGLVSGGKDTAGLLSQIFHRALNLPPTMN
ncbi:MAG: WD40 repeat domain-containing protein [Capsulimonadaceae bacterium]|nr:WD40 repeat domain-containing protein [Capsulimonadaceae bacterium]